ncbi:MAG: DUF975 family protein [Bacilli bacterium]|nr:DUF975 family protein [Bacilli bacterium]
MNIRSIKNRANDVLLPYRTQFIRVLVIVMVLQAIPSLISGDNVIVSLLSMILSLLFLPVSHGVVVSSLKMVRNNGMSVNDDDGLVGFKRFKELFPTYIIVYFFTFLLVFGICLILGVILTMLIGQTVSTTYMVPVGNTDLSYLVNAILSSPSHVILILIMFLLVLVVTFVVDAVLMPVPYLLEQYHLTGMNAVKTSVKMMKSHIFDYLKLYLSFLGWMFLAALIEAFVSQLISVTLVVTVIVGLFKIFTYLPLYYLSEAVLFEEIAFYHFHEAGD